MRIGFWRDAMRAKVLLAEGAAEQASDLLATLTPTSPRQQVTLGLLRAITLADDDRASSRAQFADASMTAATRGHVANGHRRRTTNRVAAGVGELDGAR